MRKKNKSTRRYHHAGAFIHFHTRHVYTASHQKKSMIEKEDKSEQEYVYALCVNARATSHFQYKIQ